MCMMVCFLIKRKGKKSFSIILTNIHIVHIGISQCNWEEFVKMYEAEMKNDQSLHPGSANERTPSLPSSANGRTRQEKHMAFKTQQYKWTDSTDINNFFILPRAFAIFFLSVSPLDGTRSYLITGFKTLGIKIYAVRFCQKKFSLFAFALEVVCIASLEFRLFIQNLSIPLYRSKNINCGP